jgi:hypothetical protein
MLYIMQVLLAAAMYMAPADDPYVDAIVAETHDLDRDLARRNVYAARLAAKKYGFKVEELLAQAWVESRYNPYDLSRIQCVKGVCKRHTGRWTHSYKPPGAKPTYYCGPMQVGGNISWAECRRLMHDLVANYESGASHVREWEKYARLDKRCKKHKIGTRERRTCALRGYVGGWKGLYSSRNNYPRKIFWKQARIERRVNNLVAKRTKVWEQQKKITSESKPPGTNSGIRSDLSVALSWSERTPCLTKCRVASTLLQSWPTTSTPTYPMSRLSAGRFYLREKILY